MKRPFISSQTVTRIAFVVIIVFVVAQVAWWLVFKHLIIRELSQTTLMAWQRDAELANLLLQRDPALAEALLAQYPHLRLGAGEFVVDPAAIAAFNEQQSGRLRMLVFEGPVFVLVVISGLAIIARSLRAERELKRRQQNFLSAVTHEFKTPLSTLRLLIETVLYRPLPPDKQRSYLERMERELTRLEQTSEQVLASARLEQAESAPALAAVELNSVMQGIIGRVRAGLEARGAVLSVTYSPEPLRVSLDTAAFSVVMNNLLDNAVKYSPGANKPVRVKLLLRDHLVKIYVEDEGIGVPDSERQRIFEQFYRIGSEMTRSSQGIGLGLHLVKTIVEAMNGWVKCEPNREAGRGTRFTVVFPERQVLLAAEQELPLRGGGYESPSH
jgi:signal transduction histidine kinase